jgi:hypothetical protein
VNETGRERLISVLSLGLPGSRQSRHGLPVVGSVATYELPPIGFAILLVVLARDLECDLVGLRARVGVKEDILVFEPLVELLPQFDGRQVTFHQGVEAHLL